MKNILKYLALLLISSMLLLLVACGGDNSTDITNDNEPEVSPITPEDTPPDGTTPEDTVPEETTPEDTPAEDATPEDATPEISGPTIVDLNEKDDWIHNEAGSFDIVDGIITLGGGGDNKYNKIISSTSFEGNMCMSFDVKFSTGDSAEMMFFLPRYTSASVSTSAPADNCSGNFVLHTADSKGLRLSYRGGTVVTDKSISTNRWTVENVWYSVKFEVVAEENGTTYKIKFWQAGEAEPSEWNCEYGIFDSASGGPVSFAKRGTQALELRNVKVSYSETENLPSEGESTMYKSTTIVKYGTHSEITTYHQFGTITTKAGTVLATCEARVGGGDCNNPSSIFLWRSTDGGLNWSDTIVVADSTKNLCSSNENKTNGIAGHFYANPTPVVDYKTGKIFIFYSENFGNSTANVYYRVSEDDGLSWSSATEITGLFNDDPYNRSFHIPGPGHGLQIENGQYAGRLVVEVWHRHSVSLAADARQYGLSVIYSDDGGTTWTNSEYVKIGYNMNEGRIAQLADGTLIINSRSTDDTRKQTLSTDGGATWSTPQVWRSIGKYSNCDSGFTSQIIGDSAVLVTIHPYGTSNRDNLYAYVSYDNGSTWKFSKQIWGMKLTERGTGASDVNLIDENTYGVIHGTSFNNNDVEYIIFDISYITGEDN